MKNSFPNFCNALMLRRCFLAGSVALCFTLPPITASAQLTQQQVEDAFYNALMAFCSDGSGVPGFLGTMPFDPDTFETLNALLSYNGVTSVGISAYLTLSNLVGADPRFWDFLSSLSATNRGELVRILNAVRALGSVTNQLDALDDIYSILDESSVPEDVATLVKNQVTVDDLQGLLSASSNQLASVLSILRNEENPIEVDIRDSGTAANYLGQIIDALLGGSGGSSVVGVLQGLTNSLAGGDTTPVDVQNFDDLAPVLSDFGDELSEKEWDVNVLNFDSSGSDWLTAFESSSFVRSNLSSVAFLAADARQSASSGSVVAASTPSSISAQNDDDRVVESNSLFSWFTSKVEEPPEMETYETADPPSSDYDSTMKPDLLPSSALAPTLYHNTRIKLAEGGYIGDVRHDDIEIDIFGISGGALGSWVSKLDDIVRAAYYGFLAVASALLFWRYQTKISFVLRDAPRV